MGSAILTLEEGEGVTPGCCRRTQRRNQLSAHLVCCRLEGGWEPLVGNTKANCLYNTEVSLVSVIRGLQHTRGRFCTATNFSSTIEYSRRFSVIWKISHCITVQAQVLFMCLPRLSWYVSPKHHISTECKNRESASLLPSHTLKSIAKLETQCTSYYVCLKKKKESFYI